MFVFKCGIRIRGCNVYKAAFSLTLKYKDNISPISEIPLSGMLLLVFLSFNVGYWCGHDMIQP